MSSYPCRRRSTKNESPMGHERTSESVVLCCDRESESTLSYIRQIISYHHSCSQSCFARVGEIAELLFTICLALLYVVPTRKYLNLVVVVVVVVLTLTRIIKSVVTGQAPVTLEIWYILLCSTCVIPGMYIPITIFFCNPRAP